MATPEETNKPQNNRAIDTDGIRDRTASSPVLSLVDQSDATDMAVVTRHLARFMFDLQADDYEADEAMRELAWADTGIYDFWLGQASAVVAFLTLELCA